MKIFKIRKIPINGGRIIVITGPDGSGKSTLVSNISNELSKVINVSNTAIGRPYGKIINLYLNKKRDKLNIEKQRSDARRNSSNEILKAMFIAILRFLACWRCLLFSKFGILVICDRWPSARTGSIDGPRIKSYKSKTTKIFMIMENKLYHLIPKPDILLSLDVDLTTAIERNKQRNKKGKETTKEIKDRFEQYKNIEINAQKHIVVDNRNNAAQVASEITRILANALH